MLLIPRGLGASSHRAGGESSIFGKDRLCAVVAARTAADAIRQIKAAEETTARAHDHVELRLDFLSSRAEVGRLLSWVARQPKMPTLIATYRRLQAGGRFKGSVDDEITVLKRAVMARCRWCDVEIETAERIAAGQLKKDLAPARVLVSAHDFRRLPQNLPALVTRLEAGSEDAIKIAATCRSLADASRLLELARSRADLVAIPMGDEMFAARVLALRQGSALSYAPVSESTAAWPDPLR